MFNCDGTGNTACITTGAEALKSLTFDGHTVAYPVFGMGMLSIGFVIVAFFILSSTQLTFLNLGHVGSAYAGALNSSSTSVGVVSAKHMPSIVQKDEEITMAVKQWDIEKNSSDSKSSFEDGTSSNRNNLVDTKMKRDLTAPIRGSM